jgi:hypothetical protein
MIVEAATAINPKIFLIAGGFHLVTASDDVIAKAVAALKDTFKVESIATARASQRLQRSSKLSVTDIFMQVSALLYRLAPTLAPICDVARDRRCSCSKMI